MLLRHVLVDIDIAWAPKRATYSSRRAKNTLLARDYVARASSRVADHPLSNHTPAITMSSSNSHTVGVSGMTCGSCVNTVTKALENLGPNVQATVSLASGTAHVTGPASVTYDAVTAAIEACGFTAGPCGSAGGASGGKCSAGGKCTCGDNCQCGDTCRCADCPGTCGKSANGASCPAKAKGTCTCGEVCSCGPNCTCTGCPGNKSFEDQAGRCSAGGKCNCGDDCKCGVTCNCADCPGTCGSSTGPCPAKAKGTCTCGAACSCGDNCTCGGCPGQQGGLFSKNNVLALAVVGAAVAASIILRKRK